MKLSRADKSIYLEFHDRCREVNPDIEHSTVESLCRLSKEYSRIGMMISTNPNIDHDKLEVKKDNIMSQDKTIPHLAIQCTDKRTGYKGSFLFVDDFQSVSPVYNSVVDVFKYAQDNKISYYNATGQLIEPKPQPEQPTGITPLCNHVSSGKTAYKESVELKDALALAIKFYGRKWRNIIHEAWRNGNYRGLDDNAASALQRARNILGPTWLMKVKNPQGMER